ncbi:MAG: hypothetical protein HC821_02880 [Lewinella sp.]|nr:hypothetical protein [Lewinella sp.]
MVWVLTTSPREKKGASAVEGPNYELETETPGSKYEPNDSQPPALQEPEPSPSQQEETSSRPSTRVNYPGPNTYTTPEGHKDDDGLGLASPASPTTADRFNVAPSHRSLPMSFWAYQIAALRTEAAARAYLANLPAHLISSIQLVYDPQAKEFPFKVVLYPRTSKAEVQASLQASPVAKKLRGFVVQFER